MARTVQVAKFTSDSSEVRRDFDAIGQAGEKMGKRVKDGAGQMGPGLRAMDAAAGSARQKVEGLAGSAGTAGNVLRAMGPIGLAAAAGIGAAAVAFTALNAASRDAVRELGAINVEAGRLGVSTQALQEFRFAVLGTGAAAEQADAAIAAFAEKFGEATLRRSGGGFDALRMLGFSADDIANLGSIEEALPRIADRLSGVASAAEQVRIARELGLEPLLPLLQQGAGAFDRAAESAHRLGYVLDEELLQRAAEMNGEWTQASEIIDLQLKAALVELAPIFLDIAKGIAEASVELREFLDQFKEVERRGRASVNSELTRNGRTARALIDRYGMGITTGGNPEFGRQMLGATEAGLVNNNEQNARNVYAYLAQRGDALRGRLADLNTQAQPPAGRTGGGGTTNINPVPSDPEIARLRSYVDALEAEGDARAQLNRLQAEFPNASAEELQARSALLDRMEQLDAARQRGVISSDAELEALRAIAQAGYDAAESTRAQAEALAQRNEVQGRVTAFSQSVETPLEALQRQEAELRALREQAGANGVALSDEDFARGLENIRDQYREIAAAQHEASLAGQLLRGVWEGQIRNLEDLESLLIRIASDALLQELLAGGIFSGEGGVVGFGGRVLDRIANSVTGGTDGLGAFGFGGEEDSPGAKAVDALAGAATNAAEKLAGAFVPGIADAAAKVIVSGTSTVLESKTRDVSTASLVVMTKAASAAAIALAKIAAAGEADEASGFVSNIVKGFTKGGGRAGGGKALTNVRHEFGEGGRAELLLLGGQAEVFPADAVDGLRALSRFARAASAPAGGGRGVAISLKNESGVALQAEQADASMAADGSLEITMLLRRQMQREVAEGALDKPLQQRFGTKQRRTSR